VKSALGRFNRERGGPIESFFKMFRPIVHHRRGWRKFCKTNFSSTLAGGPAESNQDIATIAEWPTSFRMDGRAKFVGRRGGERLTAEDVEQVARLETASLQPATGPKHSLALMWRCRPSPCHGRISKLASAFCGRLTRIALARQAGTARPHGR